MKKEKKFDKQTDEVTDNSSQSPKKIKKKKSKSTILKMIGGVLVLAILFLGLQYFSYVKKAEARREAQVEQEQILVSHWEEQGLSQDEIQAKLRASRMESFNPDDAPLLFQVLQTVRHATGTGPGNGTPGSGDGSGGMGMRGGDGSRGTR